jgi:SAM-dependent methyltransferase
MTNSPYYKDTGKIALASKISVQYREKMFAKFMANINPKPEHKVLDIGVTNDDKFQESNYFERLYPYKDRIVCVGTEDGSYLETKYPGIKFIKVAPGERLPFNDNEFDISFSNAVIEHVGNTDRQRAFILEMLRVSRSFFLTTPNRWFPVELHTAIPFLHFLPKNVYRKLLLALGESYWGREENLNLLSRKELISLFPAEVKVTVDSVKMLGMSTNLIAWASSRRDLAGQ